MLYPIKDTNGKLNPSSVNAFYVVNNDQIFQTLAFLASNDDDIPSYSVIGRIFAKKINNNLYEIEKIESKFYTFGPDNQANKPYVVSTIVYNHEKSWPSEIFINLYVERTLTPEPPDKPDIVYSHTGPHRILIRLDGTINFIVTPPPASGEKPINGGYECNGKAITSG